MGATTHRDASSTGTVSATSAATIVPDIVLAPARCETSAPTAITAAAPHASTGSRRGTRPRDAAAASPAPAVRAIATSRTSRNSTAPGPWPGPSWAATRSASDASACAGPAVTTSRTGTVGRAAARRRHSEE
ncbi:MAG: hypothetical protein EKK42_21300 [Pseudonocardiaceae bacterium]|nr:MAG: hypothetical protein EKK42_21300 [Pseudonocardiaceae bacterium]